MAAVRKRKVYTDNIEGVKQSHIKNLSFRAGIPKITKDLTNVVKADIDQMLKEIMYDVSVLIQQSGHKIVKPEDVEYALERRGIKIYR